MYCSVIDGQIVQGHKILTIHTPPIQDEGHDGRRSESVDLLCRTTLSRRRTVDLSVRLAISKAIQSWRPEVQRWKGSRESAERRQSICLPLKRV